jgi:hypothetical protein
VPRRVVSGNAGFGSPNRPRAAARCQYALLALAAFASCGRAPDLRHTVLTSTAQVRLLSAAQVRLGVPVRIQGVLTYFDGISSYCFVQDSQGGIRVSFAAGQVPPATGWRVEVMGLAASGGATPAIVEARISAIAPDALPRPISVSPARLGTPEYQYKRVAISGVVQSVDSGRPGLITLEILAGRATVRVRVPASIAVANESWTDADVRAAASWKNLRSRGRSGARVEVFLRSSSRTPAPSRPYASADRLASCP